MGQQIVIPYSFLLCVLDKMESTFLVQVYSLMADETDVYSGTEVYLTNMKFYHLLHALYARYGIQVIPLFKMLEPLAVATILEWRNAPGESTNFIQVLVEDFSEAHPILVGELEIILAYFRGILEKYQDRGVRIVMELYGQEKMHFYPVITKQIGLDKMRTVGTALGNFHLASAQYTCGEFVKQYIHRYHEKEGKLPPILESRILHPGILDIYTQRNIPSITYLNTIPNSEWAKVIFKPHQVFNYFPNILDMLDDKAIAPPRDMLSKLYMQDVARYYNIQQKPGRRTTRLILALLGREELSVEKLFQQLNKDQEIPFPWRLILLKMKEKELKPGVRPFSVLTLELRMMASALERNLADSILPLFQTQTITDSGPYLKNRLDMLMTLKKHTNNNLGLFPYGFFKLELHFSTTYGSTIYRQIRPNLWITNFQMVMEVFYSLHSSVPFTVRATWSSRICQRMGQSSGRQPRNLAKNSGLSSLKLSSWSVSITINIDMFCLDLEIIKSLPLR